MFWAFISYFGRLYLTPGVCVLLRVFIRLISGVYASNSALLYLTLGFYVLLLTFVSYYGRFCLTQGILSCPRRWCLSPGVNILQLGFILLWTFVFYFGRWYLTPSFCVLLRAYMYFSRLIAGVCVLLRTCVPFSGRLCFTGHLYFSPGVSGPYRAFVFQSAVFVLLQAFVFTLSIYILPRAFVFYSGRLCLSPGF